MKTLITKSDGTPTKSKVHAIQCLEKLGIDKENLIEENGQFYYEAKLRRVEPTEGSELDKVNAEATTAEGGRSDRQRESIFKTVEETQEITNDLQKTVGPHNDNNTTPEKKNNEDEIKTVKAVDVKTVTWDVEVFNKNNERTKLFIPGTDVIATINGKHPAGQNKLKSSFELNIDGENFIMSLDLISRIFKVKEA